MTCEFEAANALQDAWHVGCMNATYETSQVYLLTRDFVTRLTLSVVHHFDMFFPSSVIAYCTGWCVLMQSSVVAWILSLCD